MQSDVYFVDGRAATTPEEVEAATAEWLSLADTIDKDAMSVEFVEYSTANLRGCFAEPLNRL